MCDALCRSWTSLCSSNVLNTYPLRVEHEFVQKIFGLNSAPKQKVQTGYSFANFVLVQFNLAPWIRKKGVVLVGQKTTVWGRWGALSLKCFLHVCAGENIFGWIRFEETTDTLHCNWHVMGCWSGKWLMAWSWKGWGGMGGLLVLLIGKGLSSLDVRWCEQGQAKRGTSIKDTKFSEVSWPVSPTLIRGESTKEILHALCGAKDTLNLSSAGRMFLCI